MYIYFPLLQAFVSVSLFNAMRFPLNMMPQVAIMLFQVLISVRRISGITRKLTAIWRIQESGCNRCYRATRSSTRSFAHTDYSLTCYARLA